ncbi:MAG TPA: hypothetical protein PLH57_00495 [Oligoflexia bacterium]|nr:hypothetical protein [Oligoflexia bacterium]
MKGIVFALFAVSVTLVCSGCPATDEALPNVPEIRYDVIEFSPRFDFESPIPENGKIDIRYSDKSDDPYRNDTWTQDSDAIIGHFGFYLKNHSDSDIERVLVYVHTEDPSKIIFPVFIEFIDQLMYSNSFVGIGPPDLSEGEYLYSNVIYPGRFARLHLGTLKSNSQIDLEALIAGKPFMKFHIAARGWLKSSEEWVATHSPTEISFFTGDLIR